MNTVPPFAVLFKTHFWDDFAERQYQRLCERAGGGDVFIIIDETKALVHGIRHDRIIRMTEEMSEQEGYLRYPAGNLFWYNTDYQIYHFLDKYPEYEYVFISEYDCTINMEISEIIQAMAAKNLGFAGERIRTLPSLWPWKKDAALFYQADLDFVGRLVCCAAFSRGFGRALQAARRDQTRRVLAGEVRSPDTNEIVWPNNEAFVGAEIARLSVSELPLTAFGDTSHYDWFPPHLEVELPRLSGLPFIHPVLDGPKFIRSVRKFGWDLEDLFRQDTHIHHQMEHCDPAYVVRSFLTYFTDTKNWAAVDQLRDYARARLGETEAAHALFNIARGKPATQVSTSPWSRASHVAQDAANAVNGEITGHYGFHTDLEAEPWWCVDLEFLHRVREIRVYNRMDVPSRSRSLVASVSTNMADWMPLYRHETGSDFGGADGAPLKITLEPPIELRFLRLHLAGQEILHLDEVEIYV